MSMLGSQIDRLRTAAQTERALGHHELEQMFLDAADTITELRDESDCVGMAAYEAGYKNGSIHYELEHCPACKNVADLQEALTENAKLRELVLDMNKWLWNGADCTECPFTAECDLNAAFESDLHAHICIGWSEIHDRMRNLGIEDE